MTPTPSREWRDEAVCRDIHDPEFFFPLDELAARIPIAMCSRCPVTGPCGDFADQIRGIGVWAGTLRTAETYRKLDATSLDVRHLQRLAALATAGTRPAAAALAGVSVETIRETVDWAVRRGLWRRGDQRGMPGCITDEGIAALDTAGLAVAA